MKWVFSSLGVLGGNGGSGGGGGGGGEGGLLKGGVKGGVVIFLHMAEDGDSLKMELEMGAEGGD